MVYVDKYIMLKYRLQINYPVSLVSGILYPVLSILYPVSCIMAVLPAYKHSLSGQH